MGGRMDLVDPPGGTQLGDMLAAEDYSWRYQNCYLKAVAFHKWWQQLDQQQQDEIKQQQSQHLNLDELLGKLQLPPSRYDLGPVMTSFTYAAQATFNQVLPPAKQQLAKQQWLKSG